MAKYLRYISNTFKKEFSKKYIEQVNYPINFVFDLFQLELKQFSSPEGIVKISINFTHDEKEHLMYENFIDVLKVNFYMDLDSLSSFSSFQKRKFFLDSIIVTLTKFAECFNWNTKKCTSIYNKLLEDKIIFKKYWKKSVKNKNSKNSAQIYLSYFKKINVFIVIKDHESNTIAKKRIASLPPSMASFTNIYGRLLWSSDKKVILYHSNKKDYWEYDKSENRVNFHHEKAALGDPHGEYTLGTMYLEGNILKKDKNKAIYWLKKSAKQKFKRAINLLIKIKQESEQFKNVL